MTVTVPRPDYRRIARQHEAAGDLPAALDAWQQALAEAPDAPDIARHLADLAFRLNHWDMAEKLLAHLIVRGVHDTPTVTAYAASLREQSRYDEAIDLLKTVIGRTPEDSALWEGMGAVMVAKGDPETALIFFSEALRLDPHNLHALFNRGCALAETGQLRDALHDVRTCADAFRDPDNRLSAGIVSAELALAQGDLTNGWAWYQARHKRGTRAEVIYDLALPRFTVTDDLKGRRLFISAEQGLGDEVLFGSLLPQIADAIGPDGALGIGVEPRLVPLFARSFPGATVMAHRTRTVDGRIRRDVPQLETSDYDSFALAADFLPTLRNNIADFAGRPAFLKPSPQRVAHWRAWLDSLGDHPKAGLLWKSLKGGANRDRYFAGFDLWTQLLSVPGIQFINLQYGDSSAELAAAQARGLTLHTPPGIDLKADLDELAALGCALDVVIGPSNATTNITAACGARTWLVGLETSWLKLGQSHYPWYPNVRYFNAPRPGDWAPALDQVRTALTNDIAR